MVIEGKLHVKYDTQAKSDTFKTREFVVEYADNPLYPQFVKFQLTQDRCDELDKYNVGDKVEISFNIRGREWTNPQGEKVYFTSLEAWRLSKVEAQNGVPSNSAQPVYEVADLAADDADDLPF